MIPLSTLLRPNWPPAVLLAAAAGLFAPMHGANAADDASAGRALFQQQCALCHESGGGQGPSLAGVLGRTAGSGSFDYTAALRGSKIVWSPATLDDFLAAPQKAVPGTAMPVAVPDAAERRALIAYLAGLAGAAPAVAAASATTPAASAASGVFADWRADAAGKRHRITIADLPAPFSTPSVTNGPRRVDVSGPADLQVPSGFEVTRFAAKLDGPRVLRVAPNGDVFIAETRAGRIRVLRAADGSPSAARVDTFADQLAGPFGMAFYPEKKPQWLYVANTNSVVRFAYRDGDLQARGPAEVIVPTLAQDSGGHNTRDIVFTKDGKRFYLSVGSGTNAAEGLPKRSPAQIAEWQAENGLGAAWANETGRATVVSFDIDGKDRQVVATGIRNCVGLALQPATSDLWCATNERDGLGDDLVPDYATRVRPGAFYGWPWYYLGDHEDPRHIGERPDLAGKVAMPDVLIQPHSAPLQIAFYDAKAGAALFPPDYRGDAFVTLHGSWNRSLRTGYKVVRLLMKNGVPTGEYEDFLVGFVVDDTTVSGRPVGVAVAHDGALLVSEDGVGTVWRVAPAGH